MLSRKGFPATDSLPPSTIQHKGPAPSGSRISPELPPPCEALPAPETAGPRKVNLIAGMRTAASTMCVPPAALGEEAASAPQGDADLIPVEELAVQGEEVHLHPKHQGTECRHTWNQHRTNFQPGSYSAMPKHRQSRPIVQKVPSGSSPKARQGWLPAVHHALFC